LVCLLEKKQAELRDLQIGYRITGVGSRRLGWIADPKGIFIVTDPGALTREGFPASQASNVRDWMRAAQADVLFEATSLNVNSGQPAIDHIRAALELGAHAITANKGTVVHAYQELRALAASKNRRFLFESTVMDGAPIFSLFDTLPAIHLRGFRGILNSTTNVILTGMEQGLSFEQSLMHAQEIGIAETDPTHDVEGWDATVKVAALVIVLMGVPIKLNAIERKGVSGLSAEEVRTARAEGNRYKLVCRAQRSGDDVTASVRPEKIPLSDPLASVSGTSSIIYFETDILPGVAITEMNPGVETTAYGMLADFIRAVGGDA
jgi:homoserine dehydrogenase